MRVNWRNVRLIYLREIRDQLRDRRTLFMVAVLPVLLYPALGVFMAELRLWFTEQPRTVVVLAADQLPAEPRLLGTGSFESRWFDDAADADRLRVVTDAVASVDPALTDAEKAQGKSPEDADAAFSPERREKLLNEAREIAATRAEQLAARAEHEQQQQALQELTARGGTAEQLADAQTRAAQSGQRLAELKQRIGEQFARSSMQVLILIPAGFGNSLVRLNEQLSSRGVALEQVAKYARPEVLFNRADDKSLLAYTRVREVLEAWENEILKSQLARANLPAELPHPVKPVAANLALDEQISASLWGTLFPALLVLMSVTGAFYPAIDLVAGEKERGTMETLLICPATRTEIILGKFFTVMSFSATTALLNLLSMGMTGRHLLSMSARGAAEGAQFTLPSLWTLGWVIVLLIPLASLFSALSLALATFARSSKEGQYYLTPLLMVTLGLTVFCLSPGVELKPLYSLIPVANIALLLKAMLLQPASAGQLAWYVIPVLISSLAYSAVALAWAIDQFRREEVLFREAERFDLGLWLTHLVRDREPFPNFAAAGFCFVVILLLQFSTAHLFQVAANSAPGAGLKALMIQQVALVAGPALIMGAILTSSLIATFRCRLPAPQYLLAAIVLPVVLHPLVRILHEFLGESFFEPLPRSMQDAMQGLVSDSLPTWLVLLGIAFVPAICEEIAFRGFILAGFSHRGRYWLGILLSSLVFGLVHMIPQQIFNASLLGVLLGLLAVRSASLFPAMVFHVIHNGLMVLLAMHGAEIVQKLPVNPFVGVQQGQVHYHWPTLVPCAVMAVILIRWLARSHNPHVALPPSRRRRAVRLGDAKPPSRTVDSSPANVAAR